MKHEFFAEHPLPHKNALMEENGKYTTYATRDIYLVSYLACQCNGKTDSEADFERCRRF